MYSHISGIHYSTLRVGTYCGLSVCLYAYVERKDACVCVTCLNTQLRQTRIDSWFCFLPVWLTTQNHSTLVTERSAVPFLPVNPEYSATRNQVRLKVDTLIRLDLFRH